MVDAFNLIEFFAVASLFGWLTFAAPTETTITKDAKRNFRTVRGYFILSFLFFAVSACGDYFFHHPTILGLLLPKSFFEVGTLLTLVAGIVVLTTPMIVIQHYGWEDLGAISVPSIDYVLGYSLLAAFGATLVLSLVSETILVRQILVGSVISPLLGLILAWKYYPLKGRIRYLAVLLCVVPWLVLTVFILSGFSLSWMT